jgi:hypothetical protein
MSASRQAKSIPVGNRRLPILWGWEIVSHHRIGVVSGLSGYSVLDVNAEVSNLFSILE